MARIGINARVASATVAAGAALALTACGSDGVMTDGGTAATSGSTSVSTGDVQDAVADINRSDPQGQINGQQAAVFLALAPEVDKLASRYGATTTSAEVQQEYASRVPGGLNPAAVRTIQASAQLNKMVSGQNRSAAAAAQRLIRNAEIDLNPRYGEFSKGSIRQASTNWIDPSSPDDGGENADHDH